MSDVRTDYEHRYPRLPGRWLAYCYAVGRDPQGGAAGLLSGAPNTREWFGPRVEQAMAELGIDHGRDLSTPEQQAVTEKLWQYAIKERSAQ